MQRYSPSGVGSVGYVRFTARDAARAVGGRLVGPDVDINGASFDSRDDTAGRLFVPVRGARDGHDFVESAITACCAAYLTEREPMGGTAIVVPDTLRALAELATWARARLDVAGRVVGITGSVGKTSTKDLCAAALGASMRVTASTRSFNNDQGLPVTILGAADDTQCLVLEMGMRGFGEIERLCRIASPDVAVVTAVAEAHTERVGGIDGVFRAKSEIVTSLHTTGTAVLNVDDPRVSAMRGLAPGAVVGYGAAADADVRLVAMELDSEARAAIEVRTPWGAASLRMPVPGAHMAHNALAALAVAGLLGVAPDAAAAGIETARLADGRMSTRVTAGGARLLDDAYNANPASMRAALDTLAATSARRRVAVLGEMAELEDPEGAHVAIAKRCAELGIELVAVGTASYGVEPVALDEAIERLRALAPGDAALVKASRAAGLDRIVAGCL